MRVISTAALDVLRTRTCAVAVLLKPTSELAESPLAAKSYKVFGTGFLVADSLVLTNRHVANNLLMYCNDKGIAREQRCVSFLHPSGSALAQSFFRILGIAMVTEPRALDLAVIRFAAGPEHRVSDLTPMPLVEVGTAQVGDPVAVYGYAFAENLLTREVGETDRIYRFGPILHHGYVSGIAPFETASRIDRLLLDVRTHAGMSGSPVWDPGSEKVIGIHEAGFGDTVAFAVPLTSGVVEAVLDQVRPAFAKEVLGATEGQGEVPYVVVTAHAS